MKITIQHQESYSRGELLLRTFFGWLYIAIPHAILIYFYSIYVAILMLYAFFAVLFTEKYPFVTFEAVVGYMRWSLRLNASLMNLVDGYPPFGPNERWEKADLDIAYPEVVTRKRMLFAAFLSWFVLIPQLFVLFFRSIVMCIYSIIAFFTVLFTKEYPANMHKFAVDTYRLSNRVTFYSYALYFVYPEMTGEETEADRKHMPKK